METKTKQISQPWVPPFLSYGWWKQSYEWWKQQIQTDPNLSYARKPTAPNSSYTREPTYLWDRLK